MENTQTKQKHPKGLWLVNIATVIQNFYAYGIISFMILFFTAGVNEGGLGLDKGFAVEMYGWYAAIGYMMSLLGGWLADKYLGLQKSIIWGTLFSCFGYIAMYFSTSELWTVLLSLGILLLAAGIGKGNISAIVGALYERDQITMKDAAYSLFYMAINIGSLFGPILFGLITDQWFANVASDGAIVSYGYRYGFIAACALSFLQFLIFFLLAPKWLKEKGKYPTAGNSKEAKATNKPITKIDIDRMKAMAIMFVFSVLFWSAWNQTQTSFALLTQKGVDRTIFGWTMPTPWLTSFNGFLCAVLAPVLGAFWIKLGNSKRGDLSVATKMGLGMVFSGIAFGILILGIQSVGGDVESGKMPLMYMLVTIFILTIGELFLSPIGMSMFNKLAPEKYASLAMGIWYLSFSLSNIVSGYLAKLTVKLSYLQVFTYIAIVIVVFGVILIALKGYLEKLMHIDKLHEEAEAHKVEE